MSSTQTQIRKRTASDAGFARASVPSTQHYHHQHSLRFKQHVLGQPASVCQDEEAISRQLNHAILLALRAVGFEHADPLAVESFRVHAEKYMTHFLAAVKQSMLSSRRTQPVARDFLWSLAAHQLTLRSLLPHLDPPVSADQSQPVLSAEDLQPEEDVQEAQLISALLNDAASKSKRSFVPQHLPALPSEHTFKAKPVYVVRESDPRKIRERVTEEGRLGEQALRRLVGATAQSKAKRNILDQLPTRLKPTVQEKANLLWEEVMKAIGDEEVNAGTVQDPGGYEMGYGRAKDKSEPITSIVNADRVNWRRPANSPALGQDSSGDSEPAARLQS